MLLVKILTPTAAAIVLLLQIGLQNKWRDKRTKAHRRALVALKVGGILLWAVTVAMLVFDDRAQKRANAQLTDELGQARREIANVRDLQTGGKDFCYVDLAALEKGQNRTALWQIHDGDNILRSVQVSIRDVDKVREILKQSHPNQEQLTAQLLSGLRIGDTAPHAAHPIGALDLPQTDRKSYFAQIEAANGTFIQPIRLRRINGQWKVATKVVMSPRSGKPPDFSGKPLFKRVDPGFPLNKAGEADW